MYCVKIHFVKIHFVHPFREEEEEEEEERPVHDKEAWDAQRKHCVLVVSSRAKIPTKEPHPHVWDVATHVHDNCGAISTVADRFRTNICESVRHTKATNHDQKHNRQANASSVVLVRPKEQTTVDATKTPHASTIDPVPNAQCVWVAVGKYQTANTTKIDGTIANTRAIRRHPKTWPVAETLERKHQTTKKQKAKKRKYQIQKRLQFQRDKSNLMVEKNFLVQPLEKGLQRHFEKCGTTNSKSFLFTNPSLFEFEKSSSEKKECWTSNTFLQKKKNKVNRKLFFIVCEKFAMQTHFVANFVVQSTDAREHRQEFHSSIEWEWVWEPAQSCFFGR